MNQESKTNEELLSHNVRRFLGLVVELSEKIQNSIQNHAADDIEDLYAERRALFAAADAELAGWIKQCNLMPADSWPVYRLFLLALENEHVKKQYQASNEAIAFDDQNHFADNPFLIQEDEISDKEAVDEMIEQRRLTRAEIQEMMANMSTAELAELMKLAKGVKEGSIWERKYDL